MKGNGTSSLIRKYRDKQQISKAQEQQQNTNISQQDWLEKQQRKMTDLS